MTQRDNIVFGDQSGRDINKTYIENYVYDASKARSIMTRLIEKYKEEASKNIEFRDTIKKLEHISKQIDGEEVIGLEAKLKKAGKIGIIKFASETKELFSKKLAEHQFSETAQTIHSYLLVHIYTLFYSYVYPQILKGVSDEEVSRLVREHIIKEIENLLEENVLDIYSDEIYGMIYYLTGNCRIKWTE